MAGQGVADALVVQHPAADDLLADAPVAVGTQEQPDVRDDAPVVDTHRHGVDVEHGETVTGVVEVLAAQPRTGRLHVVHGLILPNVPRRARLAP